MLQQQKEEKLNIMNKTFKKNNIFFLIKIVIPLVIYESTLLFIHAIKNNRMNNYAEIDQIFEKVQNTYTQCFKTYILIKNELTYAIERVNSDKNNITIYDKYKFNLNISNMTNIKSHNLDNSLLTLLYSRSNKNNVFNDLQTLYSGNACEILFDNLTDPLQNLQYNACFTSIYGVITKGFEQVFTQIGVLITSVINEVQMVSEGLLSISNLLNQNISIFPDYMEFIEKFFFRGYLTSCGLFEDIRQETVNSTKTLYDMIFLFYLCVTLILLGVGYCLIYFFGQFFNSFTHFVGIIPYQYIIKEDAYTEIEELSRKYFL